MRWSVSTVQKVCEGNLSDFVGHPVHFISIVAWHASSRAPAGYVLHFDAAAKLLHFNVPLLVTTASAPGAAVKLTYRVQQYTLEYRGVDPVSTEGIFVQSDARLPCWESAGHGCIDLVSTVVLPQQSTLPDFDLVCHELAEAVHACLHQTLLLMDQCKIVALYV